MRWLLFSLLFLPLAGSAQTVDGLVQLDSQRNFNQTLARLQQAAKQRGMHLHMQLRHDVASRSRLRPTVSLALGNPRLNQLMLECSPALAIELPLRVAIWQSATGKVRLAHTDVAAMLERHGATRCAGQRGKVLERQLREVVAFATG